MSDDLRPKNGDGAPGGAAPAWQPIELLLKQGTAEELEAMRAEVARDPIKALELAEEVEFLESLRQVRTEPGPHMAAKMQGVLQQAERFCDHHYRVTRPRWQRPLLFAAAAAATLFALVGLDPLGQPERAARTFDEVAELAAGAVQRGGSDVDSDARVQPVLIEPAEQRWQETVQRIQARAAVEDSEHLRSALARGVAEQGDALGEWLDPANAVTMMRLGHELRASAELRAGALLRQGALVEVDGRVQSLATGIADELAARDLAAAEIDQAGLLEEVSLGLRAMIGAGPDAGRSSAVRQASALLARALPIVRDERLVVVLAGLVEMAATEGEHFDAVAVHGRRLLSEVLDGDGEAWRRRRPALLTGDVAPHVLGDAGRLIARLPAFGVDAAECTLVRSLILGRLREVRGSGQERPEVLAAMSYGFADLLDRTKNERDRLAWSLQRWKPALLAPDFVTVQQIAWSLAPGSRGHTRIQRELRQLAVMPAPTALQDRAAFCLCLATNYAGFVSGMLPLERPVRGS